MILLSQEKKVNNEKEETRRSNRRRNAQSEYCATLYITLVTVEKNLENRLIYHSRSLMRRRRAWNARKRPSESRGRFYRRFGFSDRVPPVSRQQVFRFLDARDGKDVKFVRERINDAGSPSRSEGEGLEKNRSACILKRRPVWRRLGCFSSIKNVLSLS